MNIMDKEIEDIKIKRLQEIITEKGWTQKNLSKKVGYTPQYINYLLNGKRRITKECADVIANILEVNPLYILGESEIKYFKNYSEKEYMANMIIKETGQIFRVCGKNGFIFDDEYEMDQAINQAKLIRDKDDLTFIKMSRGVSNWEII